jgi:Zn-dependent M28 family amino/carboxypeptidase
VAVSPAANDNVSGVAVVIEIAERLRSLSRPDVCCAFFGAEESGLDGSQWFVSQHIDGAAPRAGCLATFVNLDNVGGPEE